MIFSAPDFWQKKESLAATLLSPLSCVYGLGHRLKHNSVQVYKAQIPVICIGNLTAGGSGKTPVVQAVMTIIKDLKLAQNPCILSRGHGGEIDLVFADVHQHTYKDTGDEPLFLAKDFPVAISKNRAAGAKLIEEHHYDLILMDDGFQNNSLHKDLNILVVDGSIGFGNQKLLPAGPLREPIAEGLKRTEAVIIINKDTYGLNQIIPDKLPVFKARTLISGFIPKPETKYVGFCGIGYPEKFKSTLLSQEIPLCDFISYPDHHMYNDKDIDFLMRTAQKHHSRLITTEKDAVRLQNYSHLKDHLDVLPIKLEWQEGKKFQAFLIERLKP